MKKYILFLIIGFILTGGTIGRSIPIIQPHDKRCDLPILPAYCGVDEVVGNTKGFPLEYVKYIDREDSDFIWRDLSPNPVSLEGEGFDILSFLGNATFWTLLVALAAFIAGKLKEMVSGLISLVFLTGIMLFYIGFISIT